MSCYRFFVCRLCCYFTVILWVTSDNRTSDVLFIHKKCHVIRHKITKQGIVIRYLSSYV
jgi:hypothetical protein